ncbi:beta-ketoacyl synthase N-terminal-like domain-containing protein [Streptomyces sp. A5-4]|uniref:beta-ketoacyl synthase N-terminal-like domain-containing protein n=1 Tax=Streptomyces sp. A5-4 TaxID=3384771 RepID=UPI003DAA22ED
MPGRSLSSHPIALIGMSGMFPSAASLGDFWDAVVTGRDCLSDVTDEWWDSSLHYDANPLAADRTYSRRGGFLEPQTFDSREFGMPPATCDSVSLVQLLSLVVARDTLRDAGCDRGDWYDPARTGVVLGVAGVASNAIPLAARLFAPTNASILRDLGAREEDIERFTKAFLSSLPEWTEDSFPGTLSNIVAGRIANRFNFGGANHTVDAACASSLAAVRSAVDELLDHRADLMLTGGCDADNSLLSFLCFSKTPALSPSGHIRPFDEAGDGTLIGEGLGMLALKRLEDAERDGDRIYAVLKGLGSSSDGRAKSIYAPCGEGQLVALRRAYEDAHCSPASIGLIEAHGTGTATGDQVELGALHQLLTTQEEVAEVALGSVKSQFGHTKAAAGAAGLMKAALALHQRILPGTLHVDSPRAPAGDAQGPLYVNTSTRPWVRDPAHPVRRAGVSAFGFGGVNYHAVLEEHPSANDELRVLHRTPRAYVWHAADASTLRERLHSGAEPDAGPPPPEHARIGFVAQDEAQLRELRQQAVMALDRTGAGQPWSGPDGVYYASSARTDVKAGALFCGQGSQYVNMGQAAVLAFPPLREAFDRANAAFPAGDTLAGAVFPRPGGEKAAEEGLRRTAYAQPALGALAAGQYRYLQRRGFAPDGVLGHSFGELTALWAAGVLDDDGFTDLARARGLAMAPGPSLTDAGAMAALHCDEAALTSLLAEHPEVSVCNHNAADEYVVGGPSPAMETLLSVCRNHQVTGRRLPVAAAFHTALVEHAVEPFAAACERVGFSPPQVTVYPNTTGAVYCGEPDRDRRTLAEQLRHPVQFAARLREMYDDGIRVFVEFGPRQILGQLARRTLPHPDVDIISCDSGHPDTGATALLTAAVRLTVLGCPLTDLNCHAAATGVAPAPASAVARVLHGPRFAELARRPRYESCVAAEAPGAFLPAAADVPPTVETPPVMDGGLAQAATAHLEAHTRFLDTQLATTQHLSRLLDTHAGDSQVAAAVHAVTSHSCALSEAHTRAAEVVAELLVGPSSGGGGTNPRESLASPPVVGTGVVPLPAGTADSVPDVAVVGRQEGPPSVESVAPRAALAAFLDGNAPAPQQNERALPSTVEEMIDGCRAVVAEKTGYDPHMLEADLLLQEELGIDSLKMVELGAELWSAYPSLKREELFELTAARTIGELAAMCLEKLHASQSSELYHSDRNDLARTHVVLHPLPHPDRRLDAYGDAPSAVVFDDGGALAEAAAHALVTQGWSVCRIALPGNTAETADQVLKDWSEEALQQVLPRVMAAHREVRLSLLPVSRTSCATALDTIARLRHAVLIAKHVQVPLRAAARGQTRAAFVTMTQLDGALGYAGSGGDGPAAMAAGLSGLVKSFALETSPVFSRALDFHPGLPPARIGRLLSEELLDAATGIREVGHDHDGVRQAPRMEDRPHTLQPTADDAGDLTADDVLLVTGGGQGITAWCAIALAERYRCELLLLGRTPLDEEPAWAHGQDGEEELARAFAEHRAADANGAQLTVEREEQVRRVLAARSIRATLQELRARGSRAAYLSADLRDAASVERALAPHAARITGVVHGAGVLGDQPLSEMQVASLSRVIDTKLSLHHVLDNLAPERLRHLTVFTSVSGISGNLRQSDYALANEALNRYACAFKAAHPRCRVTPLAWGPWEGGMAKRVHHLFREAGVAVLDRAAGTSYFLEQLEEGHRSDGVTLIGPSRPLLRVLPGVPDQGLVVRRSVEGLQEQPVLRDHRIGGRPLMPMTAEIGWMIHTVEQVRGGATVTACHDFRIKRGLYYDGTQPSTIDLRIVAGEHPDSAHVSTQPAPEALSEPSFSGSFSWSELKEPPVLHLPPLPEAPELHPAYHTGKLFHGPALQGLHTLVERTEDQLVFMARMSEPELAHGAFCGQRFTPGLADLMAQACGLVYSHLDGAFWGPVSVERIELYAPIPENEPFVIVATAVELNALDGYADATACDTGGRVLQRWHRLRLLWVTQDAAVRMLTTSRVPLAERHA